MTKGIEHNRSDKKRPQRSLKEKRAQKTEKRAAKNARTVSPETLQ